MPLITIIAIVSTYVVSNLISIGIAATAIQRFEEKNKETGSKESMKVELIYQQKL